VAAMQRRVSGAGPGGSGAGSQVHVNLVEPYASGVMLC